MTIFHLNQDLAPPFHPHPLLPGGHLQTLAGHLLGQPPRPSSFELLRVPLNDGDELHLHIDAPPHTSPLASKSMPIVLLMHGLGGCSESTYNLRIGMHLQRRGFEVVRFNHRGCGRDAAHLARGIYHAARVEDLDATLTALAQARPDRALVVAAFSLSANLLLKYLGTRSPLPQALTAAMAVCPPIDLELCSQALNRRVNKYMDIYYTRRLVRTAARRQALFPEIEHFEFPKGLNLRLFDEVYTAPQGGFASRDDYYAAGSAKLGLKNITLPTLILNAADDPIIPMQSFTNADFSPACDVRHERSGGHMGFISARRTTLGDRRWMDAAVVAWAEAAAVQFCSP